MNPHCVSPEGFALLTQFEGPAGHDDAEQEAKQNLLAQLEDIEDAVGRLVQVPLQQRQFDALVSFVYSIGVEAFDRSQVLKDLNAGRLRDAATGFDTWRKTLMSEETNVLDQLVRRRTTEKLLFLRGVDEERLLREADRPSSRAPKSEQGDIIARIVKILASNPRTAHVLTAPPPPLDEEEDVLLLTQVVPPAKPHAAADGPWVLALFGLVFFVAGIVALRRDSDVLFLLFMTPGLVLLGGALWRFVAELLVAREEGAAR
jgi:GH24 family phage-related lysozyme (muramidase)